METYGPTVTAPMNSPISSIGFPEVNNGILTIYVGENSRSTYYGRFISLWLKKRLRRGQVKAPCQVPAATCDRRV